MMPQPTDVKDFHSFLGMINYLNKYSPRLKELGDRVRELIKKNVPFIWGPEHTEACDAIEKEITTTPKLRYYDPARCKLERFWCSSPSRGSPNLLASKSPAILKSICCN